MKKRLLVIGLFLIGILFISACQSTLENNNQQTKGNAQQDDVKKEETIFTETLRFGNSGNGGKLVKNKLTKTAYAELEFSINDTEEYTSFFDQNITMAPALINIACSIFTTAFFNQTALKEQQESGNLTIESASPLEGYSMQSAEILFKDKETEEKIAKCTSTGSEWKDIKFEVYREYTIPSFFGVKIGEIAEDEETE